MINRQIFGRTLEEWQLETGMELGGAKLTGTIPSEIGLLTRLRWLNLEGNLLESTIPTEIGAMVSMKEMQLQFLGLEGPIPSEMGLLQNLTTIGTYRPCICNSWDFRADLPTDLRLGFVSATYRYACHRCQWHPALGVDSLVESGAIACPLQLSVGCPPHGSWIDD